MKQSQGNLIFALDIGTRKVMGLVARPEGKGLEILEVEVQEHPTRAMLDGQIHNIEETARVVQRVKEALEARLALTLEKAAVAVAGRVLLTQQGEATLQLNEQEPVTIADIQQLELEAVQNAQRELQMHQPRVVEYHCVGYTALTYQLDGEVLTTLVGHRGREAKATVLATFLPGMVVDSLYAVLHRVGLAVHSLTLEPIAAANVVIPPSLRNLNLALVDIGAGTSDIAVTREGIVVGYGMIPLAGDEVTEKISQVYLLDFTMAEQVKRGLTGGEEVVFTDVLGYQHRRPVKEVLQEIDAEVESLAAAIVETILSLNGKPPGAVICIGGGSRTPLLTAKIAARIGLSPERVVARGPEAVLFPVTGKTDLLQGPETVTPIGIAFSALQPQALSFKVMLVKVNKQQVRLFNLTQPRVADALLAAGLDLRSLHGKIGLSLTVRVNGQFRVVKGTPGRPGRILRGGEEVSLETPLADGDELTVEPAVDGQDATAVLGDLVPEARPRRVRLNGREVLLEPVLFLNGTPASLDTPVPDGAEITFEAKNRFRDAVLAAGEPLPQGNLTLEINGQVRTVPRRAWCRRNGRLAGLETVVEDGDELEYRPAHTAQVRDLLGEEELEAYRRAGGITVTVNGEPVFIPGRPPRITLNGRVVGLEEPVPDKANLQITPVSEGNIYFAEVFNHVPMNLAERPPGKRLVLLLNGRPAEYTAPLREGDAIEIRWVEEEKDTTG